jgi:hypothetical protein
MCRGVLHGGICLAVLYMYLQANKHSGRCHLRCLEPYEQFAREFRCHDWVSTTRMVGMLLCKGSLDTNIGTYIKGNCQYYWASEH